MTGNIVNPQLVANICNNGMLGSIPAGYLSIEKLREFIIETQKLTNNPFIVNFFIEEQRNIVQYFNKPLEVIKLEKQLNADIETKFCEPTNVSMNEYIDLIIEQKIPAVSCTFVFFDSEIVAKLKTHKIKIIATATNIEEARYCATHGADAIVLQGTEAGGHQGSFLTNEPNYETSLNLLLKIKQLNLGVLLISAGGITIDDFDTYLQQGADYVQLGTVFMMTDKSSLPLEIKQFIEQNPTTTLTQNITGKWARGVSNQLTKLLTNKTYDFPRQHYATINLRNEAKKALNPELLNLWASGNPKNCKLQSLDEIVFNITNKYKQIK